MALVRFQAVKKALRAIANALLVTVMLAVVVAMFIGMMGIVDDCKAEGDSTGWCVMTLRLQATKQLVK
jgi:hypothetical protein